MNDTSDISGAALAGWSPPAGEVLPRLAEGMRRRWSWRVSRWIHAAVLVLIAAELLAGIPLSPLVSQPPAEQIELAAALDPPIHAAPLVTMPELDDARPTADEIAAAEIIRQMREALPPQLVRELLDPAAAPTAAAAEWLQQRVLDEIAAADKLSLEDQRQRLAALGGRLEQVSSAEAVDAISHKLSGLFGTAGRATQPATEPVAGDFDYDTAQLHDVKRTENAGGGHDYVAVLLDAAGRTVESALSEAEGEQLYRTFQLIKANPLLERVYRGVVMSLFDKLMREQPPPARDK